jgi:hypothetical protein
MHFGLLQTVSICDNAAGARRVAVAQRPDPVLRISVILAEILAV